MNSIDANLTVGRIATLHPQSIPVFERFGVDYCCGGARTLVEVCAAKRYDPAYIIAEIARSVVPVPGTGIDWETSPLPHLIEHIEQRYHRTLTRDLDRLDGLVSKVVQVHGGEHPDVMTPLDEAFTMLREDMVRHMKEEEDVLFALIRGDRGDGSGAAVKGLTQEHEKISRILKALRQITTGYVAPAGACGSWRALWAGLSALDHDLHAHIHIENNVLFRRALA